MRSDPTTLATDLFDPTLPYPYPTLPYPTPTPCKEGRQQTYGEQAHMCEPIPEPYFRNPNPHPPTHHTHTHEKRTCETRRVVALVLQTYLPKPQALFAKQICPLPLVLALVLALALAIAIAIVIAIAIATSHTFGLPPPLPPPPSTGTRRITVLCPHFRVVVVVVVVSKAEIRHYSR